MSDTIDRYKIEQAEDWRPICDKIPFIKFPSDWEVKVIPPFAGAVARFLVKKGNKTVSVYCDWYERLGFFGAPHWEIYPNKSDDNERFAVDDVAALLEAIGLSLEART